MIEGYLEVSPVAKAALFARNITGEVMMLNLLRFRDGVSSLVDIDFTSVHQAVDHARYAAIKFSMERMR